MTKIKQQQVEQKAIASVWHWGFLLSGLYLLSQVLTLDSLPVFADEAIYIRWAQLIIDDWRQYLFFAMNDGKTPLFIWLLVPLQFMVKDQLLAGRILSVVVGLAQIWVNQQVVKALHGSKLAQIFAMILTTILPFWFFHHHMALMDALLTLCLSLTFLFSWKALRTDFAWKQTVLAGLCLALAFLTKVPAVLFLPSLLAMSVVTVLFNQAETNRPRFWPSLVKISLIILLGLAGFFTLKLHPAFAQLFNRGNDFLFTASELTQASTWRTIAQQFPQYIYYLCHYLTWPVLLLSLLGLLSRDLRHRLLQLNLVWLAFAAPIFLLGKVVYPRYLLPVSPFLTVAAALSLAKLVNFACRKHTGQKSVFNLARYLLLALTVFLILGQSGRFIYYQLWRPAQTPFVPIDQEQYLYSWSAGYGIKSTKQLVAQLSQQRSLLVLTEGFFGTLPDGLLMYFHRRSVDDLYLTGIGQPVTEIPDKYQEMSQGYQQVLLVVNAHRLKLDLGDSRLLLEVCRPEQAPCHQVWDITTWLRSKSD